MPRMGLTRKGALEDLCLKELIDLCNIKGHSIYHIFFMLDIEVSDTKKAYKKKKVMQDFSTTVE